MAPCRARRSRMAMDGTGAALERGHRLGVDSVRLDGPVPGGRQLCAAGPRGSPAELAAAGAVRCRGTRPGPRRALRSPASAAVVMGRASGADPGLHRHHQRALARVLAASLWPAKQEHPDAGGAVAAPYDGIPRMDYVALKWLHIVSSTVLFGTGVGSAFYLVGATLTGNVRTVAATARMVVIADWIFTASTVILQPLTGYLLVRTAGFHWQATWLRWSVALYVLSIACWLPVVWLQTAMRDTAVACTAPPLPRRFWRLFWCWFAL